MSSLRATETLVYIDLVTATLIICPLSYVVCLQLFPVCSTWIQIIPMEESQFLPGPEMLTSALNYLMVK